MPFVTHNNPKLTLAGARAVLEAAERRAIEIGVPMDIAVVDDRGHLMAFARMDGAKVSSVQIALTKAETAAIRRAPSGPAMEGDKPNLVIALGLAVASHARQTPIRGGIPLLVDGQCVGAAALEQA